MLVYVHIEEERRLLSHSAFQQANWIETCWGRRWWLLDLVLELCRSNFGRFSAKSFERNTVAGTPSLPNSQYCISLDISRSLEQLIPCHEEKSESRDLHSALSWSSLFATELINTGKKPCWCWRSRDFWTDFSSLYIGSSYAYSPCLLSVQP